MTSEAQKQANARYDDKHTIQIKMKLNKTTDADVIDRLNAAGNKQGYIKELIRRDIAGE